MRNSMLFIIVLDLHVYMWGTHVCVLILPTDAKPEFLYKLTPLFICVLIQFILLQISILGFPCRTMYLIYHRLISKEGKSVSLFLQFIIIF